MDAHELRVLRRQLGALPRPTIEHTRRELSAHPDLVALLDRALASTPLPRPPDAPASEPAYLRVGLDPAQLAAVLAALTKIEASRVVAGPDEGNLSFAPTLADVWARLRQTVPGTDRAP